MKEPYRVIKIISEYSIVVNAGTQNGIYRGDILEIFIPGEPVVDPETKETLGNLDYIKAYVEVTDVYDKMCVCKNKETKFVGPFIAALESVPKLSYERSQALDVDASQISSGFPQGTSKIQIGDKVRKSQA